RRRELSYDDVPGVVGVVEAHGETTLRVETAGLRDACRYLRDHRNFRFLSDISPADYLGWPGSTRDVAGYYGTSAGRDIGAPGSQGLESLPDPKPKRFSVSYHLLALEPGAPRVRVQVWDDDGEPVPSVVV